MDDFLTLAIGMWNVTHYHTCVDEEYNAEYLKGIGFSWESAIEIAAWACFAGDGEEYEQNECPNIKIYIV